MMFVKFASTKRLISFVVAASVVLACAATNVTSHAQPSAGGRDLSLKTPVQGRSTDTIEVKFRDNSGLRLSGQSLLRFDNSPASGVNGVLSRHGQPRLERLFAVDSNQLSLKRQSLNAQGKGLADLNQWFRFKLPAGQSVDSTIADLRAQPEVESAYAAPLPLPAPSTPNLRASQGYRLAGPNGLDADFALTYPGGNGTGTKIVDLEYSWNQSHEDLAAAAGSAVLIKNGTPKDPFSDTSHGTAVLGELVGTDNGFGITGIAPAANIGLVNVANVERGYDLVNAVYLATANLKAGDVILIEQQTSGVNGSYNYVPVEYDDSVYDAIRYATAQGVIVVEAAGNGGQNLDNPAYGKPFPKGKADSGAIIVGAGAAPCDTYTPLRGRLSFSTYGQRVNLQGWGECVATTAYGDLFSGPNANSWYTGYFNGTSSASPMIAASVASISAAYQKANHSAPSPGWVRSSLINTGTPMSPQSDGYIGPLPDLKAALPRTDWIAPAKVGFLAWVDKNGRVQLAWGQSTDNVSVLRYKVFRNGQALQSMPYPTNTFWDWTAQPHTTYTYYVEARDPANNWSLPSNTVKVTTR